MVAVSLHQPNFMPWTKLMAKVIASDVYVAYDSVQFTRSEYHNRQRLRARKNVVLLSIPVRRARSRQILCDVDVDATTDWPGYHLRIIEQEYRNAPFFSEVYPMISAIYHRGHQKLVDFNLDMLATICAYLDSDTQILRASALPHTGDNTDRLIALTRAAGGDLHLTSTWGTDRTYIDWARVAEAGLRIGAQEFTHPTYQQCFDPFEPHLGVVDLLFAQGRSALLTIQRASTFVDVVTSDHRPVHPGRTIQELRP